LPKQYWQAYHEKLDGSGFPNGLLSKQIPLGARILGVCNDYCDLRHGQLRDDVYGCSSAIHYMKITAKHYYDQTIVAALADVLSKHDYQQAGAVIVSCDELTPDMCLADDLVTDSGLLLLSKGSMLTPKAIDRLVKYDQQTHSKLRVTIEVTQEITLQSMPGVSVPAA